MFIDPLNINPLSQPAHQPNRAAEITTDRAVFEQMLEVAAREFEAADQTGVQIAETLLERARLQLFQGLFDSEQQDSGDLFGPQLMAAATIPWQPRYEQVARNYSEQQFMAQQDMNDRGNIERLIDKVATEVSLEPELIRSVVAAESAFQPRAVSPVGAEGLMQLMPETARELGVEDSFDPQQNLRGGSRYLKQLLDKYDGDLDRALAAYNWGQGNLDRKGLEKMPQETRDYLARIKGRLAQKA